MEERVKDTLLLTIAIDEQGVAYIKVVVDIYKMTIFISKIEKIVEGKIIPSKKKNAGKEGKCKLYTKQRLPREGWSIRMDFNPYVMEKILSEMVESLKESYEINPTSDVLFNRKEKMVV